MSRLVKKTMKMNQDYIDRLRRIFGVRRDTEAVNRALEMALIDDEIINAHKRMRGKGEVIEEPFVKERWSANRHEVTFTRPDSDEVE